MSENINLEKYKLYLEDTPRLLLENANEIKKRKNKTHTNSKEREYLSGMLMAYLEVISLLRDQAISFQIDLDDIGLKDIDPENDLY